MCGIAGVLRLSERPLKPGLVEKMCSLLEHRGPDDHGLWTSDRLILGHRRLSILDLSEKGRNPFCSADKRIWTTYNGELYNFRELRTELEKLGHRFHTETDTEVLVELFDEYGTGMFPRLNGMFAAALWDAREERFVLVRDRYGIKPLYYFSNANYLAFASEPKAFMALPEFSVSPDPRALAELLTFQTPLADRTLWNGVRLLPPGHFLRWERDAGFSLHQYWDLAFMVTDPERDSAEWARELRHRFETGVRSQLISDRPIGTFLSGGMDTGAISAVSSSVIEGIHSFTCGFKIPPEATDLEQFFDERGAARDLSSLLGTRHHELELGSEALPACLSRVVWHLDDPRLGISYQNFLVNRLVSEHVTVVLSGVGGDELFAGYPWRYLPLLQQPKKGNVDQVFYQSWVKLLSDEEKQSLFTDSFKRDLGEFSSRDTFQEVLNQTPETDPVHRALYFDSKVFLHGLLIVEDRLSMAHSVESRVPFLDNGFVDFASRIPSRFKIRDGIGKAVLRESMKGLLPDETLFRRKQGFTPPDQSWYRGDNYQFVRELLLGKRASERGYFVPQALGRILEEHTSGKRNHRFLLWTLMCFEFWNRLFVDLEPLRVTKSSRPPTLHAQAY